MKKQRSIKLFLVILGSVLFLNGFSQNLQKMLVEKLEHVSMVIPEQCTPDDMIIIINSSVPDLTFESNMLPNESFIVTYNGLSNQYIICHEKIKFKLTVSGPNMESEDIEIYDLDKPHAYSISANLAKGKVNIISNPRNATVIFPDLNNLVLSTNQPIMNVSGKYRVNIVKAQYKNVDTLIVIPRDAEKTYNIDLVPLFAKIKLDLSTDDGAPFLKAPVLWIDSARVELDALTKTGINLRSFFDDVEFFKLYEGNIVPVNEGVHQIRIEAESYLPYKTTVECSKGRMQNISVSMEPIFGYLTFIDKQFAEGASIIVNDKKVGKVPMFKAKIKVGKPTIRIEKPGYISLEKEYTAAVKENQNTDIDIYMQVAKKLFFESEPSGAEVLLNGTRLGFTPFSTLINAGKHEILIKKSGYASEKIYKELSKSTPDEETVKIALKLINPLTIRSEEEGLMINLKGTNGLENVDIDNLLMTPADVPLPYGKYKISLKKGNSIVYKSYINHSPDIVRQSKLPNYSKSSWTTLAANYENKNNFEVTFGQIHIFPRSGLSTALINVDYKLIPFKTDSMNYNFKTLAPNIFFLNWDWRLGGSILRQLDINILGRAKYTPGLKIFSTNISKYHDVEMQNYFYGIEISTRISYFNINLRYGRQINKGKINYYNETSKEYTNANFPINQTRNVATIGISLNGKVYKSNSMLRLWNRPLIDTSKRNASEDGPKAGKSSNIFSKIKLFGKSDKTK